jgi:hypothetical protein
MSEKIRNWELRIGNFVMFQDEIVKVVTIDFHRAVIIVEELYAQVSDKEDKMCWDSLMEFIDPVPATIATLRDCNLMFPIVTNDYIVTYNVNDHKLTIDHFTIKNKHSFTVEFIHDIQNFIIDFTKIKV